MENKRISVMRKTAAILALAIAANSAIYAGAEKPVFTDPDGITVQEEQKAVVSDLKEFLDAIAMGKKEITVTKMLGEVNNAALKNYPAFSDGVIDCNGCVIHISAPLFKAVNHGFTFKNATVTGSAEITAENEGNVGAVCLFNRGTISQVFVTADVKGGKNDYVSAGIVCGHNDGTVYQCLVKGSVKTDGGNHIGGVCGFNNGAVRECSASAEIICDSSNSGAIYGGICGMSNNKISDCLFEGTFAGNPASGKEVGGICGKFHGSDWANNCMYYDRTGVPVFTTMTNGTSSFDVYTLGNGAGSWYNGYKNNNNVNYGTVENIQDFTNGVILEKLADNRADVWVQGEKYPVLWFGYTPEPDEPEEPEVTTTEPETTTTSKVTTTEPAVTTTTPKETTTEPETTTSKVTTTEPAVTTTTPKETTTEPETTTSSKVTTEPAVTTTTPKETTTEPETTTTSKVTTTEPAVTTTTPKVTTTPNVTTTEPEVTTTPAVTTPAVKKKLPPVTKTLTYDYGVSAEEIARDVFSKYGEIAAGFQKEFDIKTGSFELTMNDKTVQTGDIRQFISNIEKINKIGAVIFDDETFDIRTKADDIETVKNEVKKYFADAETAKRFIEQHRDDFTTADVIRLVQFLKNYDNNVIKTYAEFISSYQAKPGTYAVGTTYNYRNQAVAAEYNDGIIKVTVIIKEPAVTSPAVTTPEVTTSEETTSPAVTTGAKETTGPAVTTGAKETTGPAVTTGAKETTSPAVTTTGAKETTSPAVTTTGAKETTSPAVTTTEAKETTGPAVTTGAKETSAPVVTTTAKVTETTAPVTSAGPANTTVTTAVSESISSSAVTTKLPEVTVTLASTSKLMESVTEKPVTEGTAVTSKTPANTTVPAASVTTARKTEVSSVTTAKVTEASAAVTTAKVTEASAAVTTAGPANTTAVVTTAGPANTTAAVTTAATVNTTASVTTTDAEPAKTEATASAAETTTAAVTTAASETAKSEETSATLSTLPAFNIDVTDNKYNTEASASDVTETTEQPAASETTTGAPVPAETAPASSETTSAEPAVKPSEEPAKPDDSDSKNDKPANDTPQSSGTPLDPIEIEVEKPSVLEGPAAFDTNVMLNASVGISLDDAMFFQGTKSFRYTVKLSGFNAENEYFDHAAFGFALPEGYSVDPDSVSTSLNGTVSFAAADSADAAAIRKKTNDTSNGGYVIFNNVDTKGLAEDAELFTVTIRVDETSDSYKEKISVVSLYGRYTEKSTSRTTAPGVALFIGSSENKTYNTDSSYALMGLRGDITLNHKVTQIDANAILIEVLHRDADCPSAIPEYIDIDRSLVDARVEKLAKFLGDVDESDHDKPDQIDATYILRAILIKDALGADIITEEIWQGLFNGEYNF